MIRTFVLTCHKCWESIQDPTPLPSTWLCCAWAFAHVKEYAQVIHALALNTLITPSNKTIRILHLLHPLVEVDLPPFCWWFSSWDGSYFKLKAFIFALICLAHVFSSGPLGMVYELLRYNFVPNDFANGFDLFIKVWKHYSKSCSTFNITFTFYILTLNVGEVIWRHMSHCN
jgi:hypothetical protein